MSHSCASAMFAARPSRRAGGHVRVAQAAALLALLIALAQPLSGGLSLHPSDAHGALPHAAAGAPATATPADDHAALAPPSGEARNGMGDAPQRQHGRLDTKPPAEPPR